MSPLSRRAFLRRVAASAFAPSLAGLAACNRNGVGTFPPPAGEGGGSYGILTESADCPELWIPRGFRCVRLSRAGHPSTANPDFIVPQAFDGMAAFPLPDGGVRLIRNHEMREPAATATPIGPNPYDPRAGGGTTSLEVRIEGRGADREVTLTEEYVSLSGTHVNCAGGPTPWGSWLSCEETTEGRPTFTDVHGNDLGGRTRPHGYVFEVPVEADGPVEPVPLRAMGRFVHEAVAVDPRTGIVYLTEDTRLDRANQERLPGAGFYRFLPARPGDLRAGGRLQMLKVSGAERYDTTEGQTPGAVLPVEWVEIPDPDPADADTDPNAVAKQGWARGAAVFQRLEGCWHGDGSVFFNSTSGGDAAAGQVWQHRPTSPDGGELILVFESPGRDVLDSPDNLCVSPRGGLVICEDGAGVQFVRGLTQRGEIFDLVRTAEAMPEFCGATFSPGGEVLFFNIQGSTRAAGTAWGATYALWGPWEDGAL